LNGLALPTEEFQHNLLIDGAAEGYLLAHAELQPETPYLLQRYDAQTGHIADYTVELLAPLIMTQHPRKPRVQPIQVTTVKKSAEFVCYYVALEPQRRIIHIDSVSPVGGATLRSTLRLS